MYKDTFEITSDKIQRVVGCLPAKADIFLKPLQHTFLRYNILTKPQIAMFLAQTGHETLGFRYLKEIWGPTPQQLKYEGRKDLGNIFQGDGQKFCGRGLIQVTGRYNYQRMGLALNLNLIEKPSLLEDPLYACLSAGQFWSWNSLNIYDSVDIVTRKINGGFNGLVDRKRRFELAMYIL